MSRADVEAVFGPQWVQDALKSEREHAAEGRRLVIILRRRLRALDPSLPYEYDGTAWAEHEARWQEWHDLWARTHDGRP